MCFVHLLRGSWDERKHWLIEEQWVGWDNPVHTLSLSLNLRLACNFLSRSFLSFFFPLPKVEPVCKIVLCFLSCFCFCWLWEIFWSCEVSIVFPWAGAVGFYLYDCGRKRSRNVNPATRAFLAKQTARRGLIGVGRPRYWWYAVYRGSIGGRPPIIKFIDTPAVCQ